MIEAAKIEHRNEPRIVVHFPYNREYINTLRAISDARWSKTLGAWHIPYNKEAFTQLKLIFPNIIYKQKGKDPLPSG
jgi:integrase/recombinase XerD